MVSDPQNILLYDGHCPFCASYVRFVRLKDSVGPIELKDARLSPELVGAAQRQGFDVNQGMVLWLNGETYFGDDCVHRLALLTTQSGIFNRLNAWVFRSKARSKALYPVLRSGRNAALALLGRPTI